VLLLSECVLLLLILLLTQFGKFWIHPCIISVVKLRMGLMEHVAYVEEMRNACRIIV
jgi:hypothetical protein